MRIPDLIRKYKNIINNNYLCFVFFLLAFLIAFSAKSQGIRGFVSDRYGNAVPFAAIYVPELYHGTTANTEGEFQLSLKPGNYEVFFQYLGYKTVVKNIEVISDYHEINILFEQQHYVLPEFIVTDDGEDPAYYIMRRAIGLSQYYLNQLSEYSCKVYLKGSGMFLKMPFVIRRQLNQEGIEEEKQFVTETISQISFSLPNNVTTRVISTRSSSDDNQTNPMSFVSISLYRDINGIISPLSRNAFRVYRFELIGSFIENNEQINKIKVIPRRSGSDLYSGYIYIRDGKWNLHTVDLNVEQNMFSIGIRQIYNNVGKGVWMPISHDFNIDVNYMGVEINYKYLASISDYNIKINPNINHDFYAGLMTKSTSLTLLESRGVEYLYNNTPQRVISERKTSLAKTKRQKQIEKLMLENNLSNSRSRRLNRYIRKEAGAAQSKKSLEVRHLSIQIEDSARVKTVEYWNENRPVALTTQELESFGESADDSVFDSSDDGSLLKDILLGSSINFNDKTRFSYNGVIGLSSYNYNTVDGFVYGKRFRLSHKTSDELNWTLSNNSSWAFARDRFLTDFNFNYLYHPFRRASVNLKAGRISQDFDSDNQMNRIINLKTSLFFKLNYLKLYEEDYFSINHTFDIVNGLVLQSGAEYSKRRPLKNISDFYLLNYKEREYTSNIPPVRNYENYLMPEHNALKLDLRLSYTHNYYYRRVGNSKQMLYSNFPTLSIRYKEGFENILGSGVKFKQIEANAKQSFSIRLIGEFSYYISAGRFLNSEKLYTPDFKHFGTNPTLKMPTNQMNSFRTLPRYEYSTNKEYAYGFLQYEHSRILIKRLPFLAKNLMRERIYFNTFLTPDNKPLYEIGYGLHQLFLLFDLEIVTSYKGSKRYYTGFRIGIPLSGESTIRM